MIPAAKKELMRQLPSINDLLVNETVTEWLHEHPRELVVNCLRDAVENLRGQILQDKVGKYGRQHVTSEFVLSVARQYLDERTQPHLRKAIDATGIILHTALGRAVWPESVVDSVVDGLKGYVTLAIDRQTGKRSERDQRVEYILKELTGAEAATVVNNNAAATMIALAALAADKEVIISRGQLIEIGGSFRLTDVMAQSGARMVEVGTTNRTHLRDYEAAITDQTAVIFRVHPSNYRIVGFTKEVPLEQLVDLGHSRDLIVVDDLGAGALIGLERFGLPHEPTMSESIEAGADVVLASTDKLMGGPQGGVIVGKRECVQQIRKHSLARAFRMDKTCLMGLERTLYLFREPDRLVREHPTYRMLATPKKKLQERAKTLAAALLATAPNVEAKVVEGVGYLGSGSLPMEELPAFLVSVSVKDFNASELARRLRMDEACIFARIEAEQVLLDTRTLTDDQIPLITAAMGRITT